MSMMNEEALSVLRDELQHVVGAVGGRQKKLKQALKIAIRALEAQANAEPIAWGILYPNGFVSAYRQEIAARQLAAKDCKVVALFTSPQAQTPNPERKALIEEARGSVNGRGWNFEARNLITRLAVELEKEQG